MCLKPDGRKVKAIKVTEVARAGNKRDYYLSLALSLSLSLSSRLSPDSKSDTLLAASQARSFTEGIVWRFFYFKSLHQQSRVTISLLRETVYASFHLFSSICLSPSLCYLTRPTAAFLLVSVCVYACAVRVTMWYSFFCYTLVQYSIFVSLVIVL